METKNDLSDHQPHLDRDILNDHGGESSFSGMTREKDLRSDETEGNIGGPSKKRKNEGDGEVPKKTRQTQSCDACRARKVKCDRVPPGKPGSEAKEVCTHCQQLFLPCTFNYQPKKRGPPNQYLRKLRQGEGSQSPSSSIRHDSPKLPLFLEPCPSSSSSTNELTLPPLEGVDSPLRNLYPPNPNRQDTSTPYITSSGWFRNGKSSQGGLAGTLAEQRASFSTSLSVPGSTGFKSMGVDVEKEWEPHLVNTLHATSKLRGHPNDPILDRLQTHDIGSISPNDRPFHTTPSLEAERSRSGPYSASNSSKSPLQPYPAHNHNHKPPSSGPSPNVFLSPQNNIPARPNNPFDEMLPRGLLYLIVDLYFDYIYGLVPFLHRPTFMRDLYAFKEEQPACEQVDEWKAMVMGLIAFTLVQIPRSFVPLKRKEVKDLVKITMGFTRDHVYRSIGTSSVGRHILIYMLTKIEAVMGRTNAAIEYAGSQWGLLVLERANEEEIYKTMNPIESELKRRIFWLMVGGDQSLAVINGTSTTANEATWADVSLPSVVEDEYITEEGVFPRPDDSTSILSGFFYISKLFRLTGQVLDKKQHDRRHSPSGLFLQMRINEINGLYDQVMTLMDDCPPELRLGDDTSPRSCSFSDDWDLAAVKELRHFMLDPHANRSAVKDGFLVQQANIYVTQQMTRYVLLQYRDDLLALQQDELTRASQVEGDLVRATSSRRLDRGLFSEEEKEKVATDLLTILQKIPITVIAVNSVPLVWKVRFVASTLLDALTVDGEGSEGPSPKVQRARQYLWDFLRILADLEALYSLDD